MIDLASGDAAATPEQLDALEWWAGALHDYAARAWRLCGPRAVTAPVAPAPADGAVAAGDAGGAP